MTTSTVRVGRFAHPLRPGMRAVARRLAADPHVLLAAGLALGGSVEVLLVAPGEWLVGVGGGLVLVGAQAAIAAGRPPTILARPSTRNAVRLLGAVAYVAVLHADLSGSSSRYAAALYLPIVALAAALGRREAAWATLTVGLTWILPVGIINAVSDPATLARGASLAIAAGLLVVGARRTVATLESALHRVRHLAAVDRRRSAIISAVDEVSALVASDGASDSVLRAIIDLFVGRLGHRYVAIFLGPPERMLIAGQHGYPGLVDRIDPDRGVVGRAIRTARLQHVPDVRRDPDYWAVDATVRAEICAPLVVGDEVIGLINVESADELGAQDAAAVRLVADRLSTALALAREREHLSRRAAVARQVIGFGTAVSSVLDRAAVHDTIVSATAEVVAASGVTLAVRDEASGAFVVTAAMGPGRAMLGSTIGEGPSATARAIASGEMVTDDAYARKDYHQTIREAVPFDRASIAVVPLVRDGLVRGAITVARPADRPFNAVEHEALRLMAAQSMLALANADLHAEVTEATLRDPLTGLYNRRFLDATLERAEAARSRQLAAERPLVGVIMFDLDHFGEVNKRHGHALGDTVLRAFAEVLRGRIRPADIVARYGGEEFLVVLDDAGTATGRAVADLIRRRFGALTFETPAGPLRVTVSAGAAATNPEDTLAHAIARADAALAMAKRAGRDQVVAG